MANKTFLTEEQKGPDFNLLLNMGLNSKTMEKPSFFRWKLHHVMLKYEAVII